MKISVSTDNGVVSEHFGRCPEFTIVDIEDGKIKSKSTVPNPGHEPGFLPKFLHDQGVSYIVAGGMGQRAQMLFAEQGIKTIVGVTGSVDSTVKELLAGSLKGGQSLCSPGAGKGYGIEKSECDHSHEGEN
jgi:predicted Fe-Mo cluster-binding NifX family protein